MVMDLPHVRHLLKPKRTSSLPSNKFSIPPKRVDCSGRSVPSPKDARRSMSLLYFKPYSLKLV